MSSVIYNGVDALVSTEEMKDFLAKEGVRIRRGIYCGD